MAVINTNILALTAQNNLNKSNADLSTAIERLSSGLRINSAKDDAAGEAIANRMTAQINGMNQAERNANDGISLLQTQGSGLDEISSNLQRIRELSVQAASDTNTAADRTSIQTEIDQRVAEINRLAGSTSFNGISLLNTASSVLNIQVGANTTTNDVITVSTYDATAATLGVSSLAVSDSTSAQATITAVDAALTTVDSARSNIGALENRLSSTVDNLSSSVTNLSAAQSRIQDADYAQEVSNMTRAQILQQAGTSVLAQANQLPQTVLKLLQ